MATPQEIEEMNRLATLSRDRTKEMQKEKARQEAARLKDFHETMFGTKKREKWQQLQNAWQEHCRAIDANPANFNYWRVTFPVSVWATDPVTGADRSPGLIDLAEFALEDISISCYQQLHGNVVPSGFAAWVNTSGGDDGGFIVPFEEAKLILERYGQTWDVQAAKVRKLKADTETKLIRALNPWQWSGGKVDWDLVDRIEKATTRGGGKSQLYGTNRPIEKGVVGEGVDELVARAIRYDSGAGSDRSLAYALALQLKDDPAFKPRLLMMGMELEDQALLDFFRYEALYGTFATDRREIVRLTPRHVPEFLRYGTQARLEETLNMQLKEQGVA